MTEQEIVDALNECAAEIEDAGEWIIDCVIDARADEGLPPFTPEELEAATAECDRIGNKVQEIENRMDDLRLQYFELCGKGPHYYDATNRYAINWK